MDRIYNPKDQSKTCLYLNKQSRYKNVETRKHTLALITVMIIYCQLKLKYFKKITHKNCS